MGIYSWICTCNIVSRMTHFKVLFLFNWYCGCNISPSSSSSLFTVVSVFFFFWIDDFRQLVNVVFVPSIGGYEQHRFCIMLLRICWFFFKKSMFRRWNPFFLENCIPRNHRIEGTTSIAKISIIVIVTSSKFTWYNNIRKVITIMNYSYKRKIFKIIMECLSRKKKKEIKRISGILFCLMNLIIIIFLKEKLSAGQLVLSFSTSICFLMSFLLK